jgi:hypothetical protein
MVKSSKQGTSFEIATQGILTPDGLGISTQGFVEPTNIYTPVVTGGITIGGAATNIVFSRNGTGATTGGITIGGAAANIVFSRNGTGATTGGIVLGGAAANIVFSRNGTGATTGGIVLGGAATNIVFSRNGTGATTGGITIGGAAANIVFSRNGTGATTGGITIGGDSSNVVVSQANATGGIVLGGAAANIVFSRNGTVATTGGITIGGAVGLDATLIFGRGGARFSKRARQPTAKWTPSKYDPDKHLEPIDYRKKIENAIAQAEYDKLTLFAHAAKGTVKVHGRAHIVAIYRDLADGDIIIASCPPLTPIVLDLPNVFSTGTTAREIAELEDHLVLNDLFGLGNYTIKKGPKSRFVHHSRITTSGVAKVNFVGSGNTKLVTQLEKLQRREDDALLLEVGHRSRQELEQEELHLLGIID